tara:strand:- start:122 stop:226 length:105 start_codon:yes stop_codon:yes gene_type:complete
MVDNLGWSDTRENGCTFHENSDFDFRKNKGAKNG